MNLRASQSWSRTCHFWAPALLSHWWFHPSEGHLFSLQPPGACILCPKLHLRLQCQEAIHLFSQRCPLTIVPRLEVSTRAGQGAFQKQALCTEDKKVLPQWSRLHKTPEFLYDPHSWGVENAHKIHWDWISLRPWCRGLEQINIILGNKRIWALWYPRVV